MTSLAFGQELWASGDVTLASQIFHFEAQEGFSHQLMDAGCPMKNSDNDDA